MNNNAKFNRDISIIRDYSSGSKATTLLCMNTNSTFYRKFAFNEEAEKLFQQILWIENHSNQLPLPTVIRKEKTNEYCFYDMPYNSHSVGFFEYVHSMPVNASWDVLKGVIDCLKSSLYLQNVREVDENTIRKYVRDKVVKNIECLYSSASMKEIIEHDTVVINGVELKNLKYYENYLSEDYLSAVFSKDLCSDIHGDLTVENIICTRDETGCEGFYLIDPNIGNVLESSNLDYAKILQSIHGDYEFLASAKAITISGNRIDFICTRSQRYKELYCMFENYLRENFSKETIKSIYFHEIVHWLRLLPYKLDSNEESAFVFYANMLIVLNDIFSMFNLEDSDI